MQNRGTACRIKPAHTLTQPVWGKITTEQKNMIICFAAVWMTICLLHSQQGRSSEIPHPLLPFWFDLLHVFKFLFLFCLHLLFHVLSHHHFLQVHAFKAYHDRMPIISEALLVYWPRTGSPMDTFKTWNKSTGTSEKVIDGNGLYFVGGFLTKSTPFSTFPLRPFVLASRSFFSWSVTPARTLIAFSAPFGCI